MKIKRNGLGWYKISTGKNWGETRAKKFINNELPIKKFMLSLVASGESWKSAEYIIKKIKETVENNEYGIYTTHGAICVRGY